MLASALCTSMYATLPKTISQHDNPAFILVAPHTVLCWNQKNFLITTFCQKKMPEDVVSHDREMVAIIKIQRNAACFNDPG